MIRDVLLETLVTADLDEAVEGWSEELGWQVLGSGEVDGRLARFWRIDRNRHPRHVLMAPPSSRHGMVRLVQGPEDDVTGSFHHPGLFNAELLCRDVDELHAKLSSSSRFRPLCEPTTYDLASTGGACSRSFASRGPGGAGVFFTTYLSVPAPRDLPKCDGLVERMFNSAQAVEDAGEMEAFFEGVLGMQRRLEGRIASPAINRILDLPEDWGFLMVVYKGEGDGIIEIDVHEHPLPRGFGSPAGRLKPGNSFLTLEAGDLDGIAARAGESGTLLSATSVLENPPYDGRRVVLLRGPAGERIEVVDVE